MISAVIRKSDSIAELVALPFYGWESLLMDTLESVAKLVLEPFVSEFHVFCL